MLYGEDIINKNINGSFFEISEPEDFKIILGRSRTVEGDIFKAECAKDNIHIEKRVSGGGTVLLAPGMLVWTLLIPTKNYSLNQTIWFKIFSNWIINTLTGIGIKNVKAQGTSDLTIENKKISGTSLYIGTNKVLYHGTLLIGIDPLIIDRYLKIPDRMPEYRKSRKHSDFITTLKNLGYHIPIKEIIKAFKNSNFPTEEEYQKYKIFEKN